MWQQNFKSKTFWTFRLTGGGVGVMTSGLFPGMGMVQELTSSHSPHWPPRTTAQKRPPVTSSPLALRMNQISGWKCHNFQHIFSTKFFIAIAYKRNKALLWQQCLFGCTFSRRLSTYVGTATFYRRTFFRRTYFRRTHYRPLKKGDIFSTGHFSDGHFFDSPAI